MVTVNLGSINNFAKEELEDSLIAAKAALETVLNGTGAGSDFLGWVDLPNAPENKQIIDNCYRIVEEWKGKVDVVVVIGIGGSYLGAKSVIEALSDNFAKQKHGSFPQIIFAGHTMSEDYMAELLNFISDKSYALVVISKSGTTTEPAIAFRLLKDAIEQKLGKAEAKNRIVAITDAKVGALKKLAIEEGYRTFIIPDNVGGRYSVLTPVGLLPIALAGFDIRALLEGAKKMEEECIVNKRCMDDNPAIKYAAARNALYNAGKKIEILVSYNPKLVFFGEWWKQLYGESEGKDLKGIYPASVSFSTDLHSMGQFIQQGERILFETNVLVKNADAKVEIKANKDNLDGLNFLQGKRLEEVNKMAQLGTQLAHTDGGVPNIVVEIEKLDEINLGALIYFFEISCGISGYVLGVNPFDQPGVELYKKNMFALLNKPGYEKENEAIVKRLVK